MGRKYKFHEKEGAYFISFAPVFRIDIFTRIEYFDIVIKSPLNCCDDYQEILEIDVNL